MIFTSLAMLLSSISLYVGNTDVSSQYLFTKSIVDNNYLHISFKLSNISPSTFYKVRATQSDNLGTYYHELFRCEFDNVDSNLNYVYGYYGGQSNYSFYTICEVDGDDDRYNFTTDFMYAYKYDTLQNDLNINYQETGFHLQDENSIFSVDLYLYLLDSNLFSEYFEGDTSSYQDGYTQGYSDGEVAGTQTGYQDGYADAKEEYENQDAVVNSIFGGIVTIGLIPIEFFMSIFNFNILGINFTQIVSVLLSVMVIVILLRIILGGKGGQK